MSHRGPSPTRAGSLWLFGGLTVGVLILAVAILAQIPSALLARQADGGDSRARDLAILGSERLQSARSANELAAVQTLALAALNTSPAESRGASLLAEVRLQQGRAKEAEALMRAAAALSRRDDAADLWLYLRALEDLRYGEAFDHADALLRRQQDERRAIVRAMFPYLGDPAAFKALEARLALGPSWRVAFFERLVDESPDPAAAFPMLAALKTSAHPPTVGELSQLLSRLIADHRYEQAYLTWTLLMPADQLARQGNLQDGGFDGWAPTPPFGWNFDSDQGGGGEIADIGAGKGSALHINYDGRKEQWLVRQLMVLPPGDYRLSGRFRTEAGGRTAWQVICQGPSGKLAELPIGSSQGQWRGFSLDFTIPADECAGQSLVIQGKPAQVDAPIEAWFDDIAVVNRHAG